MFVETKELPVCLKDALHNVGYNRFDISLDAREEVSLASPPSFEGSRGFTVIVDLVSGNFRVAHGSWGGANMFCKTAVDNDEANYPMTSGVAVIKGESGGRGCFANLYLHPDNIVKFLPAMPTLTKGQKDILYIYDSLKSAYRKAELERKGATAADVEECMRLGFLEHKGNGIRITTLGKNALTAKHVDY
jgi:hypothetical protein